MKLYRGFIQNLESYVLHQVNYRPSNQNLIKNAKSKVVTALGYMLLGIALSSLIAIFFNELTKMEFFGYVGLMGGSFLSLQFVNRWLLHSSNQETQSETL